MTHHRNDMTPQQAASALLWLAEMGCDEIVSELPVDRLASPGPAARTERPPAAAPAAPPHPVVAPAASLRAPPSPQTCRTLDDIAAALRDLDACPLKRTATQLCFADGNPRARVMLIGEAPGREEDIEGRPFVGRSGQLLDRMLAAIGLSRSAEDPEQAVFITNTVFWRPPGNRTPTEAETTMCLPFLLRIIEVQEPKFIVCLGATPAQRLTGRNEGILRMRGRWLEARVGARTIPLLPTLHPAYLLRQPAQKRLAWRDLLALRQMLDSH